MIEPTMDEVRRAAAEEGAEPVYTQAKWRSYVRFLLKEIDGNIAFQRGVNEALNSGDGSYRP